MFDCLWIVFFMRVNKIYSQKTTIFRLGIHFSTRNLYDWIRRRKRGTEQIAKTKRQWYGNIITDNSAEDTSPTTAFVINLTASTSPLLSPYGSWVHYFSPWNTFSFYLFFFCEYFATLYASFYQFSSLKQPFIPSVLEFNAQQKFNTLFRFYGD